MADASIAIALKWLDQATGPMRSSLGQIERSVTGIRSSVSMVTGALAGIATGGIVKSLLDTSSSFDAIGNKLKYSTGSIDETSRAMSFLEKQSDRLGLNVMTASQNFGSFAAAAKGTSLEGAGARDVFLSVAEAATVMGLSNEDAQGTMTALTQMLSKGKVQAEELRGQLGERIPGAFQIAARAMNMTTAELDQYLASGKLAADVFLPRFAAQLKKEFSGSVAEASESTRANLNRLNNAWLELQRTFLQSGFLDVATRGIKAITSELKTLNDADTSEISPFFTLLKEAGKGIQENLLPAMKGLVVQLGELIKKFNEAPDDFKGAVGYGLLARLITGTWKPALAVAGIYSIVTALDKLREKANEPIRDPLAGFSEPVKGTLTEFLVRLRESEERELQRDTAARSAIDPLRPLEGLSGSNIRLSPITVEQLTSGVGYKIAQAIKQIESGGAATPYSLSHDGGRGYGAYGISNENWKTWSREFAADLGISRTLEPTEEFQDAITVWRINQLIKEGYTPPQIASIWNSGGPSWEGKVGVNAQGVPYDVPAYVKRFSELFYGSKTVKVGEIPRPQGPHDGAYRISDKEVEEALAAGMKRLDPLPGLLDPESALGWGGKLIETSFRSETDAIVARAKKTREEAVTGLDEMRRKMRELDEEWATGLMSGQQYDIRRAQIMEDYEKGAPVKKIKEEISLLKSASEQKMVLLDQEKAAMEELYRSGQITADQYYRGLSRNAEDSARERIEGLEMEKAKLQEVLQIEVQSPLKTPVEKDVLQAEARSRIAELDTEIANQRAQLKQTLAGYNLEILGANKQVVDAEVSALQAIINQTGLSLAERTALHEEYLQKRLQQIELERRELRNKIGGSDYGRELADRLARSQAEEAKRQTVIDPAIQRATVAQLELEYAQLTGTIQEQALAQQKLALATGQRMALETKYGPEVRQLYIDIAKEQARIAGLRADGSFFDGLREGIRDLQKEMPTAFDTGREAIKTLRGAVSDLSGDLADMFMGAEIDSSRFFKSLIRDLIKAQIEATLLKGILGGSSGGGGGLFGTILGGLGSLFGIGGGGGTDYAAIDWANNISRPEPFASGGEFAAHQLMLVGERGPELVKFDRGGSVIPNHRVREYLEFEPFRLQKQAVPPELDRAGPSLHPIPAFASGGDFAPNKLMLVGEMGPEVVEFGRGGGIVPPPAAREYFDRERSAPERSQQKQPIHLTVKIDNQTGQKFDTEQGPTTEEAANIQTSLVLKRLANDGDYLAQWQRLMSRRG